MEVEPKSIQRQRDAHLRSGNQIYRNIMPRQNAEPNTLPETVSAAYLAVQRHCDCGAASARNSGGFWVLLHTSVPPACGSLLIQRRPDIAAQRPSKVDAVLLRPKVATAASRFPSSIRCATHWRAGRWCKYRAISVQISTRGMERFSPAQRRRRRRRRVIVAVRPLPSPPMPRSTTNVSFRRSTAARPVPQALRRPVPARPKRRRYASPCARRTSGLYVAFTQDQQIAG